MLRTIERIRRNCWSLVLFALVASLWCARSASATVLDMQDLVGANSNLLHHYTFEGATIAERKEDKKGTLNLVAASYGVNPTNVMEGLISYVPGFDASTTAVVTARPGGDTASDNPAGGVGLTQPSNMALSGTRLRMTVETLFRPDQPFLSGGQGGLGYVVAMKEQATQRGYFLFEGAAGTASAPSMSSLAGDPFAAANQQTILGTLQTGHWYYFATTYDAILAGPTTVITSYIADLTNGDTSLTALGSVNAPGLFTSGGSEASRLGVGILPLNSVGGSTHQGAFPGGIDSVAVYNGLLDQATFQSHLDAIWLGGPGPGNQIPEPGSFALLCAGLMALSLKRRKRRPE